MRYGPINQSINQAIDYSNKVILFQSINQSIDRMAEYSENLEMTKKFQV